MEDTTNELIAITPSNQLDTTDDILAAANRRVAQLDKIMTLAIRRTNNQDWVDEGGRPYLTSSGAEKIARLFGVCWRNVRAEKVMSSDENGQFYFYEYSGDFTLGKDVITAVGTCSQKDQFFSKKGSEVKPLSEIDETNIRKAAYSNMIVNGITRILGIRNLTWDELDKSGISKDKSPRVSYASGGNGGGRISAAQAKRFFALCKQAGKSDEEIKQYLAQNFKVASSTEILTSDYETICTWATSEGSK